MRAADLAEPVELVAERLRHLRQVRAAELCCRTVALLPLLSYMRTLLSTRGRAGDAACAHRLLCHVAHGETGLIIDNPTDVAAVAEALRQLLSDEALRDRMGVAARQRAICEFSYDVLAERLGRALRALP